MKNLKIFCLLALAWLVVGIVAVRGTTLNLKKNAIRGL
jgi:hypothetical protein